MRAKGGGERMVARGEGGDGGGIKKKGKEEYGRGIENEKVYGAGDAS